MSSRTARLMLATVVALGACHSRTPTEPIDDVALANGFRARAESAIRPGPADEAVIDTRVTITNAGRARASLTVGASCTVELRVYRVGGPSTPAYDETPEICTLPARVITLAPGASETIERQVDLTVVAPGATAGAKLRVEALLSAEAPTPPLVAGRVVLPAGTLTIQ